jgi:D-glycero-alpha-D-manno-heptose-7-phosphate kinase
MACRIAEAMGIVGGKQDEYASALGGIHYFTFDDAVHPHALELDLGFRQQLRSRLVLVYSGERRLSASIHEHVWGGFRAGDRSVVEALGNLRRLAGEMKDALGKHDIDQFASLLSENWVNQKALHPSVSNPRLEDIFRLALASGALGGKACGAGGGGCLLFVGADGQVDRLRAALRSARLQLVDFDFDPLGVYLQKG